MNYAETIDYLFNKTLVFQHVGAQAYKPGLDTTLQLDKVFGCPEKAFKTIHVAGTNGKGSTSHLLAAILQKAGYRDFTLRPTCSTSANAYVWTAKWFPKSLCARLSISFSTADTPDGNRRFSSLQQ